MKTTRYELYVTVPLLSGAKIKKAVHPVIYDLTKHSISVIIGEQTTSIERMIKTEIRTWLT